MTMRTKAYTFLIMFLSQVLIWVGFVGVPNKPGKLLPAFIVPAIAVMLVHYLNIIPLKKQLIGGGFAKSSENSNPMAIGLICYFFWLLKEIIKSSISIIRIIWSTELKVNPSFSWIETKQNSEVGITIYANSITITPGTLIAKIHDNMLLVHALEASSINDLHQGEMDQKIWQMMR